MAVSATSDAHAVGNGNRRGRATRERLLAAGWETLDDLRLEQVFEALPAREIAERAGVSERAVRHHFADGTSLAEALLRMPLPAGFFGEGTDYGSVAALTEILSQLTPEQTVASVRAAAEANWREVTKPDDSRSLRRQLLILSRLGAHPELRERMRTEYYGRYLPLFGAAYQAAIDQADRRLIAPFTIETFAATLAAISEGFLLQWMADPDRITPELVAEVCVAVALSLTVASDAPLREVSDIECTAVTAPTEVLPRDGELACACHELFSDGYDTVSWSQLARHVGLDPHDLRARVPSVRSVAAAAFAVQLPALDAAAATNRRRDPRRPFPDVLCELVRVARADPWCADALVAERRAAARSGTVWIFELVPIDLIVAEAAADAGHDPRAARRFVDQALTLAATEPSAAPAQVVEWVGAAP